GDDPRVATDFLCALCMPQEIRVVAFLPHEHEMRGRHALGDKTATLSGTGERIGAHAVPAGMRVVVVTCPQLLVDVGIDVLDDACASEVELLPFRARNGSYAGGPFDVCS